MTKAGKSPRSTAPESPSRTIAGRKNPPESEAGHAAELHALEQIDLGMVGAMHAFQRWIHTMTREAGYSQLSVIDALVLDQLRQRGQHRRLADLCFILNMDDMHVVGYSLRKLAGLGVVDMTRHGKEVTYSIAPHNDAQLTQLRADQERQLLDALAKMRIDGASLAELARYLRRMTGLYDQAARAAASF